MIDWSRVFELRDEVGAEDFHDVVELFLDEVDEAIARLGPGLSPQEIEQSLHFLKGSAMNLGFSAFAESCRDGERCAARGQADAIDLDRICHVYKQSRDQFVSEWQTRLAA